MRTPHRVLILGIAALTTFYAGFSIGQHSTPIGNYAVEQTSLATINLAEAIEGLPDRELGLSRVTIAPCGHIGLHSHAHDPTVVYLVSGVLMNHHDDGRTEEYRAGQAFAEFGPKSHWVENKGSI